MESFLAKFGPAGVAAAAFLMMDAETAWAVTMLMVHSGMLVLTLLLIRKAPCWLQGLAIFLIAFGFFLQIGSDVLNIAGVWMYIYMKELGDRFLQFGVILYVVRLHHNVGEGKWKQSSR